MTPNGGDSWGEGKTIPQGDIRRRKLSRLLLAAAHSEPVVEKGEPHFTVRDGRERMRHDQPGGRDSMGRRSQNASKPLRVVGRGASKDKHKWVK